VIVFGKHAPTGIDICLHPVDRGRVGNVGPTRAGGGVLLGAATVEQDDVVLVQVRLAIPQSRRRIRICSCAPSHLVAGVGVLRLIVQPDRARAAWQGEFRCVYTNPAKQTLQALGSISVGTCSTPSRNGDLGYAQVLTVTEWTSGVVVVITDVSRQAQQGYRRGFDNRIILALVGDQRRRNGDLAPPLTELHDQREINAPGHVAEDKVSVGISQRCRNRLARHLAVARDAAHRTCGNRV
jgi:hypothetical protein